MSAGPIRQSARNCEPPAALSVCSDEIRVAEPADRFMPTASALHDVYNDWTYLEKAMPLIRGAIETARDKFRDRLHR